jgi:catechol 2,3-dioxygenase-like lactoylglutathione lyase family enzyme
MPSSWEQIVVDAEDPARLARWWAEALGYVLVHEAPDEVEIRRDRDQFPGLLFTTVPDAKGGKNRLHLDLRPNDQESEVERLVDMGARPVDFGQHDVSWPSGRVSGRGGVVLADPEGNEFCVLSTKRQ